MRRGVRRNVVRVRFVQAPCGEVALQELACGHHRSCGLVGLESTVILAARTRRVCEVCKP